MAISCKDRLAPVISCRSPALANFIGAIISVLFILTPHLAILTMSLLNMNGEWSAGSTEASYRSWLSVRWTTISRIAKESLAEKPTCGRFYGWSCGKSSFGAVFAYLLLLTLLIIEIFFRHSPPPSDWINWLHNHPSETINSMNDWWNWRQHYSYCIRVDWLTGLINDRILIDLTIDSVSGEVKWLQRDFDIDPPALMYFFSSIEVGGFAMIGNTLWGFSWFALVFQLISDCLNPIIKSFSPAPPMHCQQFN